MLPLSVRLYSILALASYVLLGLPVWWQLTRIHRPPLPHAQMQSINTSFYLPIELNLVLPTSLDETYRSTLSPLLLDRLHLLGLKRLTIAATSYEDSLVSSLASLSDDQVDKTLLRHVNGREEGRQGRYWLFVILQPPNDDKNQPPRLIVGQFRHAMLRVVDSMLNEALSSSCPALASTLLSTLGPSHPPLSAAGEAVLSFSLYNAKQLPSNFYTTWDFSSFERRYLKPFISALSSSSIRLETQSQVMLFGEPSKIKGPWSDERGAYLIRESKLTEWMSSWSRLNSGSLGSSRSVNIAIPPHLLHFVAYVPPADQHPLCILSKQSTIDELTRRSFFVPSWGGVHIINISRSKNDSGQLPLPRDELHLLAMAFITHLRALLGLSSPGSYPLYKTIKLVLVPSSTRGISEWEVDALTRRRVTHNLESIARSLRSLSLTVEQIPRLEMPDEIGDLVAEALDLLGRIRGVDDLEASYGSVVHWAQEASGKAEQAFSNPAVLAQLSHPESHDLGVYMPLFLPLAITILGAIVREVKYLRGRSRKVKND